MHKTAYQGSNFIDGSVEPSASEMYALLPAFFQEMEKEQKKAAFSIIEKYGKDSFNAD